MRTRAKSSPVRNLMLDLMSDGIEVKFISNDSESRVVDVFTVKAPDEYSFEQNIDLLKKISTAMLNCENEIGDGFVLTSESARIYCAKISEMKEQAKCKSKKQESLAPQEQEKPPTPPSKSPSLVKRMDQKALSLPLLQGRQHKS